jgi:uncharacterized membrane protein YraQ (UPF0718 family)
MGVWDFIQDQVLGMKWLNELLGIGLSALGLDVNGRIGGSIQFFIYDVLKITVLLCVLIFVISYIQSYFPPERSKRILGRFHGIWANIIAALLGTVTPFCSCSSIPLFIGFTSAGLPLGVTFSFLISSPMVDLGSLVLLMSIFGAKIAIVYVVVGLVIAVIGGTIIEKMHMENYVEDFIRNANSVDVESDALTVRDRLIFAKEQVIEDPPHNCAQPRHIIPADPNFEKKRNSSALFAREINLVTQPSFDCEQGINSQVQTACSNADAIFPVLGIVFCKNERFSLLRKTHVPLWNEPRISHVRLP